jgi:hypothetical protein
MTFPGPFALTVIGPQEQAPYTARSLQVLPRDGGLELRFADAQGLKLLAVFLPFSALRALARREPTLGLLAGTAVTVAPAPGGLRVGSIFAAAPPALYALLADSKEAAW